MSERQVEKKALGKGSRIISFVPHLKPYLLPPSLFPKPYLPPSLFPKPYLPPSLFPKPYLPPSLFPKPYLSPKPFPKPFPEKAWRKQAGLGKALPSQSQVLDKGVVLLARGRREGDKEGKKKRKKRQSDHSS